MAWTTNFIDEEHTGLTRKGLLVKGGAAAAGLTVLGSPTAAAFAASTATKLKVAVVTHGDTGSFWSVFKKGVDQAAKDLKGRGVSVTQVYANNDVAKQVAGINAAIAGGSEGDRNVCARCERAQGSTAEGRVERHRDHHRQLRSRRIRLAADVRSSRRPDRGRRRQGAGKQFKKAGAKKVLIVIHEARTRACSSAPPA